MFYKEVGGGRKRGEEERVKGIPIQFCIPPTKFDLRGPLPGKETFLLCPAEVLCLSPNPISVSSPSKLIRILSRTSEDTPLRVPAMFLFENQKGKILYLKDLIPPSSRVFVSTQMTEGCIYYSLPSQGHLATK